MTHTVRKRKVVLASVRRVLGAPARRPMLKRRDVEVSASHVAKEQAPPPWSLGPPPRDAASSAVSLARAVFPDHPEAVDAVLGWLFTRFAMYGATGSDMVAHHAMLRSELYYQGWVTLCSRLKLFARDP